MRVFVALVALAVSITACASPREQLEKAAQEIPLAQSDLAAFEGTTWSGEAREKKSNLITATMEMQLKKATPDNPHALQAKIDYVFHNRGHLVRHVPVTIESGKLWLKYNDLPESFSLFRRNNGEYVLYTQSTWGRGKNTPFAVFITLTKEGRRQLTLSNTPME